jgi:uncharacterized protein (TIGR00730 family)
VRSPEGAQAVATLRAVIELRRVAVYCGSRDGGDPAFARAAEDMGAALAARGIGVVYGGATVGLMGRVADAALAAGGEVVGVLPQALEARELAHQGLSELHVVGSMHERKALMADLADGFIALPGGLGTLDELFEVMTWAQLGIHAKPIGLLNIAGFFDPLLAMVDQFVAQGFVDAELRVALAVDEDPATLINDLRAATPPAGRWTEAGAPPAP